MTRGVFSSALFCAVLGAGLCEAAVEGRGEALRLERLVEVEFVPEILSEISCSGILLYPSSGRGKFWIAADSECAVGDRKFLVNGDRKFLTVCLRPELGLCPEGAIFPEARKFLADISARNLVGVLMAVAVGLLAVSLASAGGFLSEIPVEPIPEKEAERLAIRKDVFVEIFSGGRAKKRGNCDLASIPRPHLKTLEFLFSDGEEGEGVFSMEWMGRFARLGMLLGVFLSPVALTVFWKRKINED